MYSNVSDKSYRTGVIFTGLVVGGMLIILRGLTLFKNQTRLASGLSLGLFLGLLSYNIGNYIVCEKAIAFFNDISISVDNNTCYNYGGYHLRNANCASLILAAIGLSGYYIQEPRRGFFIGLGVGTSLISFMNWYSSFIILNICVTVIISLIFAFIVYRYPSQLYSCLNWLVSYFIAIDLLSVTVNLLWLSNFSLNYSDKHFFGGGCILILIVIFIFVSSYNIFKSKKPSSKHIKISA